MEAQVSVDGKKVSTLLIIRVTSNYKNNVSQLEEVIIRKIMQNSSGQVKCYRETFAMISGAHAFFVL